MPRILVVIVVPELLDEWIAQTEENLVMRRCGYWFSLRSYADTGNVGIELREVAFYGSIALIRVTHCGAPPD